MPYAIAAVVLVIAGAAFILLQSSAPSETIVIEEPTQNRNQADVRPADAEVIPELRENQDTVTELNESLVTPESEVFVVADGVHTAESSYFTPNRVRHDIVVTLTVAGGIVTAAEVEYDGGGPSTPSNAGFDTAYRAVVVGQPIEDINLSRVGGASLTSESFNEAVQTILQQA